MIRTAQMMLCEALRRHTKQKKLELFMDIPAAPFGIQNICLEGLKINKQPGEWYGPVSIMQTLEALNQTHKPVKDFEIIICEEGNIFLDKIKLTIESGCGCFISIPLRLGLS